MKRSELIERIIAGAEYLQRDDISPEQEAAAKNKLAKYREQLREMDAVVEVVQPVETGEETPETHPLIEDKTTKTDDERVSASREAIRAILAGLNK